MKTLTTTSLLFTLLLIFCLFQVSAQTTEIPSGASLIFGRPQNPQAKQPEEAQTAQGGTLPPRNNRVQEVDDAIALGNISRDRKPPDYDAAEKAYLLAVKLNYRDPRPYVGLGNIYMDQRRYAEAAQQYQKAIRYGMPLGSNLRGIAYPASLARLRVKVDAATAAEWHAYLAISHLGGQKLMEAESELRKATQLDRNRAEWVALLGYSLSQQGRYTGASEAYGRAVELHPSNSIYQQLQSESSTRAQESSARDRDLTKQLNGTRWEIRSTEAKIKGSCELRSKQSVRCGFADYDAPYDSLLWQVEDGMLLLRQPSTDFPVCTGRIEGDSVSLRCLANEFDRSEVWRRRKK